MPYCDKVRAAEILSERLNISIGDLTDIFADIPSVDVAPKSEVAIEVIKYLESNGFLNMTLQGIENLKKLYGATDINVGDKKRIFTPEEVRRMTQREVIENYSAIIKSMKFWS